MSDTTILILGLGAIIMGFVLWKRIQVSRKGDHDFERREKEKEELS